MNHSTLQPTFRFQPTLLGRHRSQAEEVRLLSWRLFGVKTSIARCAKRQHAPAQAFCTAGLVQKESSLLLQHKQVNDGTERSQGSKGQQRHRSVDRQLYEVVTAAQPGRERGLGPSRRARTDTRVAGQPAVSDVANRAAVPSVAAGVHTATGGGHGVKRGPRPQRKHAATTTARLQSQLARAPGQIAGRAGASVPAAEPEHAQSTHLRTRAQGGRKRRKKAGAGQG